MLADKIFVLHSESEYKYVALNSKLMEQNIELEKVNGYDTETPQPFGKDNIRTCARIRIGDESSSKINVGIENGLMFNNYGFLIDVCYVVLMDENGNYYDNYNELLDTAILVPDRLTVYQKLLFNGSTKNGLGYKTTVGEYFSNKYSVPKNN
jgi:hypothetical protein